MASRLDITDMQAIALLMGGKCLSKEYWDESSPLSWRCEKGHNWDAPYKIIRQGGWCRQCAKHDTAEERMQRMQDAAQARGGICLSAQYINAKTKLRFQCARGHTWLSTPDNILAGSWCIKCYHADMAIQMLQSIGDIQEIAKSKGGVLLSTTYKDSSTKMKWQCAEGHEWEATAALVKFRTWCPRCAGIEKKTIEEMHELAKQHNGKCLSATYINNNTSLKWQCEKGHVWSTNPKVIIKGHWCPQCNSPHRLTAEEKQKLIELYLKGKSMRQLCKEHDVSWDTLTIVLHKSGAVKKREKKEKAQIRQIVRSVKSGILVSELAKKYNLSILKIYYLLRKEGVVRYITMSDWMKRKKEMIKMIKRGMTNNQIGEYYHKHVSHIRLMKRKLGIN